MLIINVADLRIQPYIFVRTQIPLLNLTGSGTASYMCLVLSHQYRYQFFESHSFHTNPNPTQNPNADPDSIQDANRMCINAVADSDPDFLVTKFWLHLVWIFRNFSCFYSSDGRLHTFFRKPGKYVNLCKFLSPWIRILTAFRIRVQKFYLDPCGSMRIRVRNTDRYIAGIHRIFLSSEVVFLSSVKKLLSLFIQINRVIG